MLEKGSCVYSMVMCLGDVHERLGHLNDCGCIVFIPQNLVVVLG